MSVDNQKKAVFTQNLIIAPLKTLKNYVISRIPPTKRLVQPGMVPKMTLVVPFALREVDNVVLAFLPTIANMLSLSRYLLIPATNIWITHKLKLNRCMEPAFIASDLAEASSQMLFFSWIGVFLSPINCVAGEKQSRPCYRERNFETCKQILFQY